MKKSAQEANLGFPEEIRLRTDSDQYPNAFAFGKNSVAVSTGLLQNTNTKELRAVMAHEIGHLEHSDTTKELMELAAYGPLLPIAYFNTIITTSIGAAGLIGVAIAIMFFLVLFPAWFALLFFSLAGLAKKIYDRRVEFAADEYAVKLTRDDGLIEFFGQIEAMDAAPSGKFLASQLRSHPPIAVRMDNAQNVLNSL